jgi:hypothetical protein
MLKTAMLFMAALMVTACTSTNPANYATPADYEAAIDAREARINAVRMVAASQLALWMPAPSEMDKGEIDKAMAGCSISMLAAAASGETLMPQTSQWCAAVSAAKFAPDVDEVGTTE